MLVSVQFKIELVAGRADTSLGKITIRLPPTLPALVTRIFLPKLANIGEVRPSTGIYHIKRFLSEFTRKSIDAPRAVCVNAKYHCFLGGDREDGGRDNVLFKA